MRTACLVLTLLVMSLGASAQEIANGLCRIAVVQQSGACVGFDVAARKGDAWVPVAEIRWASMGRWTCSMVVAAGASIRFTGFAAPGTGTPDLGRDTAVTVSLGSRDPFPRVRFRLTMTGFDEARWRTQWRNLSPVYFLRCSLPSSAAKEQVFYQHGLLYPGPEVDAYPITMGPMRGDWCDGWSYAPAMGAAPIPAVGLWSPASRLFVAYEFGEALYSDWSAKHVASSYCAGLDDHPGQFFSLSWPYAENWTQLKLPTPPVAVESVFRIAYSTDMPSDDDPNRLVLRTMAARYADSMPPAPRMNDVSWLRQGLEGSQVRFLHDLGLATQHPTTNVAPILLVPYERCEKVFFDPGAVQLIAHQTGKACRYAWSVGDTAGLAELKRQVEMLIPEAVEERYGEDVCYVWRHPLHGQFKTVLGGANATGTRHMFNWGIASAMLWFYRYEHDPRYLYFIDGMVKWTRHCLYDRAGMADLPWAVFSMGAANGGEFLLDYYYTFRDDPERGALAQEAWRLAETIVYRNSYPYLGDPVETDTLDPSFLLQAVNSAYWIGAVTWGEMGRVPEMWIRMYLETGDPLLKYLVRGCMEQYYIGTINSAGAYTENLLVFQGGGMSGGWGGNNFRWLAEPLGSAVMQVSVGPKAALAFCKGTRALDVADYAYAPRGNCRFRVVADRTQPDAPTGPFDIMLTSPHEGIAGKPVRINGETLAAERYVIGSDGVNALVRGVRGGDVVTVGEAPVTLAPKPRPDFGVRRAFHPATTAGGAKQIPRATQDQAQPNRSAGVPPATGTTPDWIQYDLRRVAQEPVDTLWSGPWGGLVPGPKVMAGVAATFLEPAALGGRGAMSLRKPLTLTVTGAGPHVLFLGMPRPPKPVFGGAVVARCIVRNADGTSQTVTLNYEDGFEVRRGMEWYDKSWWIRAYPIGDARQNVAPASRRQQATRLTVTGSALLFAVSSPRSARARAAALAMRASTETRKRRQAYAQVQMPTRAATTSVAWTSRLPYRFLIRLSFASEPRAAGERSVRIVRVRQDLRALLAQVGIKAEPDPTSLEACLVGRGTAKPQAVACQLCPDDPSEPARGDLLLRLPPGAGSERLVAVYFGSGTRKAERPQAKIGPAYEYRREGSKAILSNGRLRMVFELSGIGAGPRMTEIGPEGGPNWLGPTGHDAGYAHLCACQDGVTWYDFGALQDTDATAEIVDSGPLATTVRFGNLRIYGEGPGVPFAGVGTRGERRASVKGVAEWYVRLYAGEPRADNWVSYTITDPSTAWTRPMEVRYAPAEPTKGRAGGTMGEPGAWARQGPLAMVALDLRPDRAQVAPYYTEEDGNLIGVRIAKAEAIGRFVSDVWRIVPASLSADALVAEADAVGVEQFAIERRSGQSAIRRKPVAVPLAEDDADRWSQRVAGEIVASIEAGSPDREDGIANNDNADEGTSARTRVGHIWCIAPGTTPSGQAQQFTYFDIEPEAAARVRGRTVFIAIEYLDLGRATVELHYDSGDPAVTRSAVPGAFKDASGMLRLGATGKRKTHVFSAPDPRFEDNCNGADFRLSVTGGPFHITRVALLIPSH